jgi:hypothetical protein
MKTIQRTYLEVIKNRLLEPVKQIQVLAGPRQVGKTTLVRQALEVCNMPYKYISADAVAASDYGWLNTVWNDARLAQKNANTTYILAIDEIQKVYQWSEKVKQLWEEDRFNNQSIHLVLLGSSRLLLQQGLTESLAGRFELIHIPHWRYSEMNEAFNFSSEEFAWFGAFPGAANLITDEDRWKQYIRESLIETAISKDLLMLTRIDKPALLRNLFELGSSYSGQILSFTKLMGQLQDAGNTTTLSHYLRLLDGAGLLTGLPKFAIDKARTKSSSPRFQVFNNALMNCYQPQNFIEAKANPEIWGRVVESAIGTHFLTYREEGIEMLYYREGADEVDYVLTFKEKFIALEIKTSRKASAGLNKFSSKFAPHRSYLISPEGLTWQELLKLHPAELF